ncbi:MAG: LysR family transcriptional regulator [Lautropia sp.]
MNLRHMEVFRAVMLTGGVNGAAELLHISQPAISKLLARAARESGMKLFDRVKGRLVPTPEARTLYEEVEKLWRTLEHVREVSRALVRPSTGSLRLAVSASLAPHLAPRAVALLHDRFPRLESRVEVLIAPIMVDALLDGSADLAVGLLPNDHPNLVTVATYRCELACVMRADHPLASRRQILPADLRGHRVIASPADTRYGESLRRAYGRYADQLDLGIVVRSSTTACWFAQAGAGIAVVDRAAVSGTTFAGLAVRPYRSAERLEIRIIRNRYRPLSVVHQAFCEAFERAWGEATARADPAAIARPTRWQSR